jgi:hypothetical protein
MNMAYSPPPSVVASIHPLSDRFYSVTVPVLQRVNEHDNYKTTIGNAIFCFVRELEEESKVPKITGMLIDLPFAEIVKFMVNFDLFRTRVAQASALLSSHTMKTGV